MRWLVLLLVSGCAHVEMPCIGVSGVQFFENDTPNWSCEDFLNADQKIYNGFVISRTKDNRINKPGLAGWRLQVINAENWKHGDIAVAGLTYCTVQTMYIHNRPFGRNAITHEYVHAIQNCAPLGPYDPKLAGHSNWDRDGIWEAINTIDKAK